MDQQNQPIQPNVPQESQQTQPNIQPEAPQKSGLAVWAIVLIIAVGLIVVGAVGYGAYRYFTPEPAEEPVDEIANWQIYRNEEYGFEFKYPNSWVLNEGSHSAYIPHHVSISTSTDDLVEPDDSPRMTEIKIMIFSDLIRGLDYLEANEVLQPEREIKIGNNILKEQILKTDYGELSVWRLSENKRLAYGLRLSNGKFREVFDKVKSTFNFFEAKISIESCKERDNTYKERRCLIDLAVIDEYPAICDALPSIQELLERINLYGKDSESLLYGRDECYYKVAVKQENVKLCEKISINEPNYPRAGCVQKIAKFTDDVSICDTYEFSSEKERAYCYFKIARSNMDSALCDKIRPDLIHVNDITIRNECFAKLAVDTGDRLLCDKLTADVRGKDWCRSQVAVESNSPALCEEIKTIKDRDNCWDAIARKRKDASYCEKIVDQYDKKSCFGIVELLLEKTESQ